MEILVSGATGFIGRSVVQLLAQRHRVTAVVRRPVALPAGVEAVFWDMTQRFPRESFPNRVDAVVLTAQSRRYREFPNAAGEMLLVNATVPATILSWAVEAGASRICYLSSGSVYEPFAGVLREDAALAPHSILACSKLAGEYAVIPFRALLPVAILRLFFPYGPGQVDRLFPEVVARVQTGRPIDLGGTEGLEFPPIFVRDIAEVIEAAIENAWSCTVNVAGPSMVSLKRLGLLVGRLLEREPMFRHTTDSPGTRIVPDLSRFRRLFDCARLTDLEQGMIEVIIPERPRSSLR